MDCTTSSFLLLQILLFNSKPFLHKTTKTRKYKIAKNPQGNKMTINFYELLDNYFTLLKLEIITERLLDGKPKIQIFNIFKVPKLKFSNQFSYFTQKPRETRKKPISPSHLFILALLSFPGRRKVPRRGKQKLILQKQYFLNEPAGTSSRDDPIIALKYSFIKIFLSYRLIEIN